MLSSSHPNNKFLARPARRVTWDPAIDQTHTQHPIDQQPPISPAYVYAYEAMRGDQSLPLYIYSWVQPEAPDGSESLSESDGEEEEDSFAVNSQVAHKARGRAVHMRDSRDSVHSKQSLIVPGWKEYETEYMIPRLRPVPITARRGSIEPPPRTEGRSTPHPMAQISFRQQMENHPPAGTYDQRGRTTDPRFFLNGFSASTTVIPAASSYFQVQAPVQPWKATNELLDGRICFKMYDVVYVTVWSYLRNVIIWTKGSVLQPVIRLSHNGTEERCYKVCIKNPDNGEDQYVVVSPALGQIRPATNETLPPQQTAMLNVARDFQQPPPASVASAHRASCLESEMIIKKGTYVFNRISWDRKKGRKARIVWVPGVCTMPNEPNGYWIRGLGGPVKGVEYLSYGPFKTFGKRTLRELKQTGEAVDVTGCDSFA